MTSPVVGDMIRPLKLNMPDYVAVEDRIMVAVAEHFGLPLHSSSEGPFFPLNTYLMPPEVKDADTRILLTERTALMSNYRPSDRWGVDGMKPLDVTIHAWSPQEAETHYLARLNELTS